MDEYIERTEELMLAMYAGARAIENTKRYHGTVYTKDVFSESQQEIPYLQAAKVLRETSDAPAADVVPVVHGEWRKSGPLLECQSCGEIYSRLGGNAGKLWNYCPNCGAKMDGDSDES